ncbi:MAG: hypothetical protein PHC92_09815, partial [Syntrophomonadaceae bacterium]|nr:hypothetical protein [Syntrophomonadaceae bacterium]
MSNIKNTNIFGDNSELLIEDLEKELSKVNDEYTDNKDINYENFSELEFDLEKTLDTDIEMKELNFDIGDDIKFITSELTEENLRIYDEKILDSIINLFENNYRDLLSIMDGNTTRIISLQLSKSHIDTRNINNNYSGEIAGFRDFLSNRQNNALDTDTDELLENSEEIIANYLSNVKGENIRAYQLNGEKYRVLVRDLKKILNEHISLIENFKIQANKLELHKKTKNIETLNLIKNYADDIRKIQEVFYVKELIGEVKGVNTLEEGILDNKLLINDWYICGNCNSRELLKNDFVTKNLFNKADIPASKKKSSIYCTFKTNICSNCNSTNILPLNCMESLIKELAESSRKELVSTQLKDSGLVSTKLSYSELKKYIGDEIKIEYSYSDTNELINKDIYTLSNYINEYKEKQIKFNEKCKMFNLLKKCKKDSKILKNVFFKYILDKSKKVTNEDEMYKDIHKRICGGMQ